MLPLLLLDVCAVVVVAVVAAVIVGVSGVRVGIAVVGGGCTVVLSVDADVGIVCGVGCVVVRVLLWDRCWSCC